MNINTKTFEKIAITKMCGGKRHTAPKIYLLNYGEVSFGDITKETTKSKIKCI